MRSSSAGLIGRMCAVGRTSEHVPSHVLAWLIDILSGAEGGLACYIASTAPLSSELIDALPRSGAVLETFLRRHDVPVDVVVRLSVEADYATAYACALDTLGMRYGAGERSGERAGGRRQLIEERLTSFEQAYQRSPTAALALALASGLYEMLVMDKGKGQWDDRLDVLLEHGASGRAGGQFVALLEARASSSAIPEVTVNLAQVAWAAGVEESCRMRLLHLMVTEVDQGQRAQQIKERSLAAIEKIEPSASQAAWRDVVSLMLALVERDDLSSSEARRVATASHRWIADMMGRGEATAVDTFRHLNEQLGDHLELLDHVDDPALKLSRDQITALGTSALIRRARAASSAGEVAAISTLVLNSYDHPHVALALLSNPLTGLETAAQLICQGTLTPAIALACLDAKVADSPAGRWLIFCALESSGSRREVPRWAQELCDEDVLREGLERSAAYSYPLPQMLGRARDEFPNWPSLAPARWLLDEVGGLDMYDPELPEVLVADVVRSILDQTGLDAYALDLFHTLSEQFDGTLTQLLRAVHLTSQAGYKTQN